MMNENVKTIPLFLKNERVTFYHVQSTLVLMLKYLIIAITEDTMTCKISSTIICFLFIYLSLNFRDH